MRNGRTSRRRKRKLNTLNVPVKIVDAGVIQLNRWAHQHGLQCELLQCAVFKDTGRGMLAQRHIAADTTIISVPCELLITIETVHKSSIGHLVPRLLRDFHKYGIQVSLAMFLLHEKLISNKSFWFPYLNTLPKTFTTPVFLPDNQLAALPPFLKDRVLEQRKMLLSMYEAIHDIWIAETGDCNSSYEDFRWAWFVVNTRSVYLDNGDKQMALIPVLDMLNHSATVEVDAGLVLDMYQITIKQPCNKGEQVFINYGPHDNATLWMEYGFTVPNNPHSVVHVNIDLSLYANQKSLEILKEQNLMTDLVFSMDGPSWKLLCCLRVLCMDYEELRSWKTVLQGTPISVKNERKVITWMKETLHQELTLVNQVLAKVDNQHVLHICNKRKEIISLNKTLLK